jgi:hypothetical protein
VPFSLVKIPGPKILLVTLLAASLILFALPAQISPSNFLQDDAYFYLQVANNVIKGYGSTFHRITPTNGYHPLWMLNSILGLLIAGNDKILGLNIIFGIQTMLFLGTAIYFRKIARLISDEFWMVGVCILAAYFFSMGIYASEAHLNAFMLVLSLYYFLRTFDDDTPSNWIKAGFFSGLSVLARLDNVFITGSLFSLGLLSHQDRGVERVLKRSVILGSTFACTVAPYLIYNYVSYGHIVPISGAIKSTFPAVTGNFNNLGMFGRITSVFGPVSVLISFGPGLNKLQRTLLRILGVGVALHASYVVLYTDHYTFWPWYYVSGVLNLGFLSSSVLQRITSIIQRHAGRKSIAVVRNLIIALLILAGVARGWAKAYNPDSIGPVRIPKINQYRWPDEVAIWMRDNIPPASRVVVYDWPGAIAYYSDLQILPVDGLMNDYEYNDDILSQGINRYLCTKDVHFFFGPDEPGENGVQEFEVIAPLYREPAGVIKLLDQNLIARVRDVVQSPQETPPLAIWRIDPCNDAR